MFDVIQAFDAAVTIWVGFGIMVIMFPRRFLSVSRYITPPLLDSQLYTDQAEDAFHTLFWSQKTM